MTCSFTRSARRARNSADVPRFGRCPNLLLYSAALRAQRTPL